VRSNKRQKTDNLKSKTAHPQLLLLIHHAVFAI